MNEEAAARILEQEKKAKSDFVHNTITEKANDGAGNLVTRYDREEAQPNIFPDVAWTSIFKTWRDEVGECTDAPLENLWAGLLLAIGLVIGRTSWFSFPNPKFANFYLLLVGPSGISRKSTVLWFVNKLLEVLEQDITILRGIVSSEGIIEPLSQRAGMKALGYSDEFRSLLAIGNRKGSDLLAKLNQLYGCGNASTDRRKDPATAIDPFFSLMAGTPPEYIDDLVRDKDIFGGFYNRFLTVSGTPRKPKARPKKVATDLWDTIVRMLTPSMEMEGGEMDFDGESSELWGRWFDQWTLEHRKLSPKERNLTERIPEQILKIALVYSWLERRRFIAAEPLAKAIKICGWLEANMLDAFKDVGLDKVSRAEAVIIRRLKKAQGGIMSVRNLQMYCGSMRITSTDFSGALKVLKDTDHIADHPIWNMGRKIKGVRLLSCA